MSLKKILLKGTTRMSLHERFSSLRHEPRVQGVQIQSVHRGLFGDQPPASARNRKLAQSMDRRPTVIAALRIKKQLLRNRVGPGRVRAGLSIKDRLTLRGRVGIRGRVGGVRGRVGQRGGITGQSPLSRPQSRQSNRGIRNPRGNLSRSQSVQSLNTGRRGSFNRGGGGGGRIRTDRFQDRVGSYRQEFRRGRGSGGRGLRSRGGGFNRYRDDFRSSRGGRYNDRGNRSRGFRSRGGRGGSRGRGRGGRGPPPSREELDSQLDQYMSGSRNTLDRELDSYMGGQDNWD